jgi:glycosyltransferase involved in cell wall biosynthesis
MKILWVKSDFLHPTTKGGHIRTLETLRRLHRRNEVHYVAFSGPEIQESLRRSGEYCTRAYPVEHAVPKHGSPAFAWQLAKGLVSDLPVAVMRYASPAMQKLLDELMQREQFDSIVCDFLFPAPNFRSLSQCVLFQHNIETTIWRRHADTAKTVKKAYFNLQANRMFRFEQRVCREARHVIAVSPVDAQGMRDMFGIKEVSDVPTGVDIEYFGRPAEAQPVADLVFVGSMDWLPNIDGMRWFIREVLPLIRRERRECSVAIVGREPTAEIRAMAREDAGLQVTGTVADVRPHLWGSAVSIVPLRIGGGTRLKIYESMAAKVPVVSTAVGAEGLAIHPPSDIRIADDASSFARECLALLRDADTRRRQAETAWRMVASEFSWDRISERFESILLQHALRETKTTAG